MISNSFLIRTFYPVKLYLFLFSLLSCLVAGTLPLAKDKQNHRPATVGDSLYSAHHPRLMFNSSEIPALYSKVRDGGYDDAAYNFIRTLATTVYPQTPYAELLGYSFGVGTFPNLGLATYLESPQDTAARAIGRRLTTFLADNYDVDSDGFFSSLRLRALALGYDMFFQNASDAERTAIRDEIESYVDTMLSSDAYRIWYYRPYLSNKSAMVASALGLAAICLEGETDHLRIVVATATADTLVDAWLRYQVDPEGAYKEGAMYAGWGMRNLIYYFHARKRYDGYNYADNSRIRNMETWFAHAMLPAGQARVNNINDTAYLNFPLSRNHTYFDWAQSEWGSGLSAWLWERTAGPVYGYDPGSLADKAGTVLWNQNLPPQQPDAVLPLHFLWQDRGLYYFRTGWQMEMSSNDVVFSFYSGKFHGGHAHEDQNNFTLYGYGGTFAADNGYGDPAKQSEAHNMVFIDGIGQHNAGGAIGTDGEISEFLLSGYADYIQGDATSAYTTYSEFNRPDYPFPGTDWSWGYDGGNPVNFALRRIVVNHDEFTPPYFIIIDDIDKDGFAHTYEWRLQTLGSNTVDTTVNPIRITSGSGYMDLHVLNPSFDSLVKRLTPFDNNNIDPDCLTLSLSLLDIGPNFTFLMFPADASLPGPVAWHEDLPWGLTFSLDWGGGKRDFFMLNLSGDTVSYAIPLPGKPAGHVRQFEHARRLYSKTNHVIETDAAFALVRLDNGRLAKYLLSNASLFSYNRIPYVVVHDGTINVGLSGSTIDIDRSDADFVFYAPGAEEVLYRDQTISIINNEGYITPDTTGGHDDLKDVPGIKLRVYPNPFRTSTNIAIELDKNIALSAVVYDLMGRKVKKLWQGPILGNNKLLTWDGTNELGSRVGTGVYILKISAEKSERATKLVVIR